MLCAIVIVVIREFAVISHMLTCHTHVREAREFFLSPGGGVLPYMGHIGMCGLKG